MKLDLSKPFRTLNKQIIREQKSKDDKTGTVMTLRGVVLDSLLGQCLGDGEPGGSKARSDRYSVAVKIQTCTEDEVDLELEELTTIKTSIENRSPGLLPLFHGQALAMIEDKATGLEE